MKSQHVFLAYSIYTLIIFHTINVSFLFSFLVSLLQVCRCQLWMD